MADRPLLRVSGLRVVQGKRTLLDGVSLAIPPGQAVAVIGPNGAGKSTLLRAVAGIVPCQGDIEVDGQPTRALSARERARLLAYVPQHSDLDAPLRVWDVVAQGRYAHRDGWGRPSRDDAGAITAALAATDALAYAERPFTRLSYGERRLVLLARALATGAPLLLLDEPTAALDVAHALSLLSRVRALAGQGRAVLVALHHLDEVVECCSRAVLLRAGVVVRSGPVEEVVAEAPVREVFGVDLCPKQRFGYRVAGEREP